MFCYDMDAPGDGLGIPIFQGQSSSVSLSEVSAAAAPPPPLANV
jgi:hypothetical protein